MSCTDGITLLYSILVLFVGGVVFLLSVWERTFSFFFFFLVEGGEPNLMGSACYVRRLRSVLGRQGRTACTDFIDMYTRTQSKLCEGQIDK